MDRNLSEPGGGGDNPVKQSLTGNRGKKKMRDDTDGAGKKPKKQRGGDGESSREVEPTTRRVKDLLKKIDLDLKELTEDELSSFMRSLGHRNTRKHTKAERDAYKSTVEETNKCLKDMLKKFNYFEEEKKKLQSVNNEMIATNQAMWAKCEELQKEMEVLRYQRQLEELLAQDPVQGTHQAWGGPIANTAFDAAAYTPQVMNPESGEFGGIQPMCGVGLAAYQTPSTTFDAGASTSTAAPQDKVIQSLGSQQNRDV